MKQQACQLSLKHIGLILAAMAAAPAALAGPDILKCVDRDGHITLTDQPCPPGTSGGRMEIQEGYSVQGSSGSAGNTGAGGPAEAPAAPAAPALERYPAPPPPRAQPRVRGPRHAPFARDAATLKAAHAQLLILDGARPRGTRLAGLD
jgi:hypothetical protein